MGWGFNVYRYMIIAATSEEVAMMVFKAIYC